MIDIQAEITEGTVVAIMALTVLAMLAGALLGFSLGRWWDDLRRPHRAFRSQLVGHKDPVFEDVTNQGGKS